MAAALTTSRPAFYQPALSLKAAGHPSGLNSDRMGEIVTGADDVNQCIYIILTTPRGSDPQRPLFGSDIYRYIDYPVNSARPYIAREVIAALGRDEPRIRVVRVNVTLSDTAAMQCEVEWTWADSVAGAEIYSTGGFAL